MVSDKSKKRLPPYVSYRTFRNFIDALQQGIPARVDRSYWGDKWSGSTGTQLVAALRFLGLVDSNGTPTTRLRQLVLASGDQRTEMLKQISYEAFGFLFQGSFDPKTATYAQLQEVFKNTYQLTGDVVRKCTKFFIGLASDADVPLSPFILKRSRAIHTTKTKRITKRALRTNRNFSMPQNLEQIPNQMSWDRILITKFPTFDPNWTDEVKLKWFEAFDELLRRSSRG